MYIVFLKLSTKTKQFVDHLQASEVSHDDSFLIVEPNYIKKFNMFYFTPIMIYKIPKNNFYNKFGKQNIASDLDSLKTVYSVNTLSVN